jgi:O-antigen ligase
VTQFELNRQVITIRGDPHNSYAFLLAGGGVLALGSFLLLSGVFVVDSLRRLRGASAEGQALVVWALATWAAFMINAATGPVLASPVMLMTVWVLLALPSVVAVSSRR